MEQKEKHKFRIAIAGFEDEVNTFINEKATINDFCVLKNQEVLEMNEGAKTYIGGMIKGLRGNNVEIIPTVHAYVEAASSGIIEADTYQTIKHELINELDIHKPLDGICLALHGAGVADGIDDIETDILKSIREKFGSKIKIAITLDLHGNINPNMANYCDLIFPLNLAPHTDMFERGLEAATNLIKVLKGSINPYIFIEKLPLLMTPITTKYGIGEKLLNKCLEVEQREGIIDCACFHGFPYADVNEVGTAVIVTSNGNKELAIENANKLASWIWENRSRFIAPIVSAEEGIEKAKTMLKENCKPIFLLDSSDNPGGGGSGNNTHLLRHLIDSQISNTCYAVLKDPKAVDSIITAGIGKNITLNIGGNGDSLNGEPIQVNALIKNIADGTFKIESEQRQGEEINLGKTALIQVGGIDLIVAEEKYQPFDPGIFRLHNMDYMKYDYIVLKSTNHWRAGFANNKYSIIIDMPGYMSMNLSNFKYTNMKKQMWPLFDFSDINAYNTI